MKTCANCNTPKRGRACPVCSLINTSEAQVEAANTLEALRDTLAKNGHKDKRIHIALRRGATALRDQARNNRHVAKLVKISITNSSGATK